MRRMLECRQKNLLGVLQPEHPFDRKVQHEAHSTSVFGADHFDVCSIDHDVCGSDGTLNLMP